MLLHSCKKCWFLLFLRWFQCQPARKSNIKMKFLRSEVDLTFEVFSILLYRKECWEYVFLRMWWANRDNTKAHDFFKANTKDFQPNNHLAVFKHSPSCTSLNKHIILKKKHKFPCFFFVGVFSPTWCEKKVALTIVKVLNFGSARTFSPKRQLLWRILGIYVERTKSLKIGSRIDIYV